jgi:hypothetical protein
MQGFSILNLSSAKYVVSRSLIGDELLSWSEHVKMLNRAHLSDGGKNLDGISINRVYRWLNIRG